MLTNTKPSPSANANDSSKPEEMTHCPFVVCTTPLFFHSRIGGVVVCPELPCRVISISAFGAQLPKNFQPAFAVFKFSQSPKLVLTSATGRGTASTSKPLITSNDCPGFLALSKNWAVTVNFWLPLKSPISDISDDGTRTDM